MAPMPPQTPIYFSAFYASLPSLVQSFVRIFIKELLVQKFYLTAFFSGVLAIGVFAGTYVSDVAGQDGFFYVLGAPGPVSGEGLSFVCALAIFLVARWLLLSAKCKS